jgi:hypothetical protein
MMPAKETQPGVSTFTAEVCVYCGDRVALECFGRFVASAIGVPPITPLKLVGPEICRAP